MAEDNTFSQMVRGTLQGKTMVHKNTSNHSFHHRSHIPLFWNG